MKRRVLSGGLLVCRAASDHAPWPAPEDAATASRSAP